MPRTGEHAGDGAGAPLRAGRRGGGRSWPGPYVTAIGRHLFDATNGWDGSTAAGGQLVVVTHRPLPEEWLAARRDAPFHTAGSVPGGIALASDLAGDGLVCVTAGGVGEQAFSAGLVDEVATDVAP